MHAVVSIIVAIIAKITIVGCVTITECGNGISVPDNVSITNCTDTESICKVISNEDMAITMSFNAPRYLENITPVLKVKSLFGEQNVTVDTTQRDACLGILNTFCPLVKLEHIQYKVSVKFNVFPLIPSSLEFYLMDKDTNEPAVCFKTNIFTIIRIDK